MNTVDISSGYKIFNYFDEVFENDILDFNVLKNTEKIYLIQEYTRNNRGSEYLLRGAVKKLKII